MEVVVIRGLVHRALSFQDAKFAFTLLLVLFVCASRPGQLERYFVSERVLLLLADVLLAGRCVETMLGNG